MNGIWYYGIGFLIIWIVAFLFKSKLEKWGVEVGFPLLMWKTSKLQGFIDKIAFKHPKFWKWFMNIGIVLSFALMIVITYSIINALFTINQTPAVSIVIPGVEIPGSPIYIPFVYGLIAMASVIFVHEISHAIMARVEGIEVDSVGLLLLAVLPGAFAEVNEEQIEESSKVSRLRVFAAGSMANVTLSVIALLSMILISSFAVPCLFDEDGIEINRVVSGSPASEHLQSGMILESINNQNITNSDDYVNIIKTFTPGETINITTNNSSYEFTLTKNPNNASLGFLGIEAYKNFVVKEDVINIVGNQVPWIIFSLAELLKWVYFLNLGVGLFNLLPMKPLDGGRMFEILLSYPLKESIYKPIVKICSYFFIIIVVFSILYGIFTSIL